MRLLSTIRLTDNQKRVLAKIAAAPTPTVAGEAISKEPNLVAARNTLMKLGVITFVDNRAEITDKGQHLGKEENILDDAGGLTDAGNKLAFTKTTGQPEPEAQSDAPPAGGMDDMGGMSMEDPTAGQDPLGDDLDLGEPKTEGFVLLKKFVS